MPACPATGRRLCAAARACVHVGPVLGVDALLAHGGELPALRHEHDDEGDGCRRNEAAADADILESIKESN